MKWEYNLFCFKGTSVHVPNEENWLPHTIIVAHRIAWNFVPHETAWKCYHSMDILLLIRLEIFRQLQDLRPFMQGGQFFTFLVLCTSFLFILFIQCTSYYCCRVVSRLIRSILWFLCVYNLCSSSILRTQICLVLIIFSCNLFGRKCLYSNHFWWDKNKFRGIDMIVCTFCDCKIFLDNTKYFVQKMKSVVFHFVCQPSRLSLAGYRAWSSSFGEFTATGTATAKD